MNATTINPELRLGDLVTQAPGRVRVLERFGLDYCCGGQRTLAQACTQANIDLGEVVDALSKVEPASAPDWTGLDVAALSQHVVETHHAYLWQEMPRLRTLANKVVQVHGERHPELERTRAVLFALCDDLSQHLTKEERILFPAIGELERGALAQPMRLANPIQVMLSEHDAAGEMLEELRELSDGYTAPEDGCASYRALFAGLAQLESDLHAHIHKENNVLFPRALQLDGEARAAG